ncbi:MAG: hypothetical protein AAF702_41245 [Chloroflexota bacterium]
METRATSDSSANLVLVILLVSLLLLLVFWLLLGPNGRFERPTGLLTATTPTAAGTIIPINNPLPNLAIDGNANVGNNGEAGAAPNNNTEASETENSASEQPNSPISSFAINQSIVVADASTLGPSGHLRLLADAGESSAVLNVYSPGAELVVLEPSGEYSRYPIVSNGISWIRVQDRRGLVGWTNQAMVQPAIEQAETPLPETSGETSNETSTQNSAEPEESIPTSTPAG